MYTQRECVVYQEIARTNRQEQELVPLLMASVPGNQAAPAVEAMLSGFDSSVKPYSTCREALTN